MENNFILIILLIIIGLPMINYNFRLLIVILIGYLLIFPEQRIMLYKNLGLDKLNALNIIDNSYKNLNNKNDDKKYQPQSKSLSILYEEGNEIIKQLKNYKKENRTVYLSIKLTWKKLMKLTNTILLNQSMTYPHQLFSILLEQRKYILNQMSAIIVSLEPLNLQENTLTKERTLPLDTHIRSLIRKMDVIINYILDIVKKYINYKWDENPYLEISPVELNTPLGYNQNQLDVVI